MKPNQKANRTSLKPIEGANRSLRRRLSLKGEFALAIAPTTVILLVLALVQALSQQRLRIALWLIARLHP